VDVGEADAGTAPGQRPGVVAGGERGPDGALGVVLVGGGDAEHRHEPVTHHVRHGPAVLLGDPPHGIQARPDEGVDLLGIQRGHERGEAGEVHEQQRDQLPLAAGHGAAYGRARQGSE
jgi:hypothetical protein